MSTKQQDAAWEMAILQEQLLRLPVRQEGAGVESHAFLLREDVLLLVAQANRRILGLPEDTQH